VKSHSNRSGVRKVKAVVWLHTLRMWRYKYSFLNMALSTIMWIMIFILGALMFLPGGEVQKALPAIFWGVAMWNIISSAVWLIGGWTNFYLTQGFFEEHVVVNTSSFLVLSFRAMTGLLMSTVAIGFTYLVISSMSTENILVAQNPTFMVLGLVLLIVMALSYGLTLSALSFRVGVPHMMLEIMNFLVLIVGGLATPVSKLPEPMRYVALVIPYSHPAELVRYGTIGIKPYLPLEITITTTVFLTLVMLIVAVFSMRWVERYVRKNGLKAIGRM